MLGFSNKSGRKGKISREEYMKILQAGVKTSDNTPQLRSQIKFLPTSYINSEKLYNDVSQDFPYLYIIDVDGTVVAIEDYRGVKNRLKDERWVMLVASKIEI